MEIGTYVVNIDRELISNNFINWKAIPIKFAHFQPHFMTNNKYHIITRNMFISMWFAHKSFFHNWNVTADTWYFSHLGIKDDTKIK